MQGFVWTASGPLKIIKTKTITTSTTTSATTSTTITTAAYNKEQIKVKESIPHDGANPINMKSFMKHPMRLPASH